MTTLTAEGASGSGTLTVDDTTVMIMRTRSQGVDQVAPSEKRIPLMSIEAVRWRQARTFTNGYIQFALADAAEHRRSVFKAKDQNVVLFGRKHQPEFEMIRAHVEARLGWTEIAGPSADAMEQLTRLAELHHDGLLTVEDFSEQKVELMRRVGAERLPTGPAVLVPASPQSERLRQVLWAVSGSMDAEDVLPGVPRESESGARQDAVSERLARAGLWFRS